MDRKSVITTLGSHLEYLSSRDRYKHIDILGTYNRTYSETLNTKFTQHRRLLMVGVNDLEVPQSWLNNCLLTAIEQVDKLLENDDRLGVPFLRRLLSKRCDPEVAPPTISKPSDNEKADLVKTTKFMFNRRDRRRFAYYLTTKLNEGLKPYKYCSKSRCPRCKLIAEQMPVSECKTRHVGEPCSPSGIWPHVKETTFKKLHDASGALPNLKVGPRSYPNPLKLYSFQPGHGPARSTSEEKTNLPPSPSNNQDPVTMDIVYNEKEPRLAKKKVAVPDKPAFASEAQVPVTHKIPDSSNVAVVSPRDNDMDSVLGTSDVKIMKSFYRDAIGGMIQMDPDTVRDIIVERKRHSDKMEAKAQKKKKKSSHSKVGPERC